MKKIAILQSNYIPWKGYFDLINLVDEFILYDDMQYTRRDFSLSLLTLILKLFSLMLIPLYHNSFRIPMKN